MESNLISGGASIVLQGAAEVKFDQNKTAFNSQTNQLGFTIDNAISTKIKSLSCQWDFDPVIDCSNQTLDLSQLEEGDRKLKIKMTFETGQAEEAFSVVRIDRTAPTIQFLETPSSISNSSNGLIKLSSQDQLAGLKTVTCRLNSAAPTTATPCTQIFEYSNLSTGSYTLTVKAEDQAGNTSERTYSWNVDLLIPTVSTTSSPNPIVNSTSASFSFTGTNHTGFECALNNEPFSSCVSPKVYTSLLPGAQRFKVRALRNNGNVSTVIENSWSIDTSIPNIMLGQKPAVITNSKNARFEFSSGTGTEFYCSLDSSSFSLCSSPKEYANLAEGNRLFKVKSKNAAGTESVESIHNWTIDSSTPTVNITGAPPSVTNQTSARFDFSGIGLVSFQCKLNSGEFEPCTSPKSYSGLVSGVQNFQVIGKNAANTTSAPTVVQWTVDLDPPSLVITSRPSEWSSTNSATFTFSSNKSVVFECQLDNGSKEVCSSPKTYSSLIEGAHRFNLQAKGSAGLNSQVMSIDWTIETSPPQLSVTKSPPRYSKENSSFFEFSSSTVGATFECELNNQGFSPCQSPRSVSTPTDQNYSFKIKSLSRSGIYSNAQVFTWTRDATAPTNPTLTLNVGEFTSKTTVNLNFSAVDAQSGIEKFECRLNSLAPVTCTSPFSFAGLTQGPQQISIMAFDYSGNSVLRSQNFFVDTTPPIATMKTMTPGQFQASSPSAFQSFTFETSDQGGSGVEQVKCFFNNVELPCATSANVTASNLGPQTFAIRVFDRTGLEKLTTFSWTYSPPQRLPEYNLANYTDASPGLIEPYYLMGQPGRGYAYTSTSCGVFKISNNGNLIEKKEFNIAGRPGSIYENAGRIFVGTPNGLYISDNGGSSFQLKLDAASMNSMIASQPGAQPCGSTTFNRLNVRNVNGFESTIIVNLGSVVISSVDNGNTFSISKFFIDEGQINAPPTAGITMLGPNEILVASNSSEYSASYSVKRPGQTSCQSINKSSNPVGLFISRDSGKTFLQINNTGSTFRSAIRLKADPQVILSLRGAVSDPNKRTVYRSGDGGTTFAQLMDPLLKATGGELDEHTVQPLFTEIGSQVFLAKYRDYTTGGDLLKSSDRGLTWSKVSIGTLANQNGALNSMMLSESVLAVATNEGIYISSDSGTNFSKHLKFTSNFCVYPWWKAESWGDTASFGNKIFKRGYYSSWRSTDSGQNWVSWNSQGSLEQILVSNSGSTLLVKDDHRGMKLSTDGGVTFGGYIDSYYDPSTSQTHYWVKGLGSGGIHTSLDSQNFSDQIESYFLANSLSYYGSISKGSRAIASAGPNGLIIFENGVYARKEIVSPFGMGRIRYILNRVFIISEEILYSDDFGNSFQVANKGPYRPLSIWQNGSKLQSNSMWEQTLKESVDGGQTWYTVDFGTLVSQ